MENKKEELMIRIYYDKNIEGDLVEITITEE